METFQSYWLWKWTQCRERTVRTAERCVQVLREKSIFRDKTEVQVLIRWVNIILHCQKLVILVVFGFVWCREKNKGCLLRRSREVVFSRPAWTFWV